jgi:hypothetical protein
MAKIRTQVEAKDKEGNPIDLAAGGSGNRFRLLEPGWYYAIVRKIESKVYAGKKDPSHEYMSVTPVFEIVRDSYGEEVPPCEISRQSFVVGAIKDGALYRTDGDTSKPALWGGSGGAQYLLLSLGLLTETAPGHYAIDVDIDLVADRVVRVKVETAEFTRDNPQEGQEAIGKKNLITQIRSIAENTEENPTALADRADELGYVVGDNKQVYLSELVRINQERLMEAGWNDEAF